MFTGPILEGNLSASRGWLGLKTTEDAPRITTVNSLLFALFSFARLESELLGGIFSSLALACASTARPEIRRPYLGIHEDDAMLARARNPSLVLPEL